MIKGTLIGESLRPELRREVRAERFSVLWRRYLAVIFDGLRPEGAHALPAEPPQLT